MAEVLAEIAAYPTTTAVGKAVGLAPLINAELPPPGGPGFLAGTFPDGTTTVEGVPVQAAVRAMLRMPGSKWDGRVVGQTTSAPDGTWRIDGLNPALRYDVVGRLAGYNDVIVANVRPTVMGG